MLTNDYVLAFKILKFAKFGNQYEKPKRNPKYKICFKEEDTINLWTLQ